MPDNGAGMVYRGSVAEAWGGLVVYWGQCPCCINPFIAEATGNRLMAVVRVQDQLLTLTHARRTSFQNGDRQ